MEGMEFVNGLISSSTRGRLYEDGQGSIEGEVCGSSLFQVEESQRMSQLDEQEQIGGGWNPAENGGSEVRGSRCKFCKPPPLMRSS